MQVSNICIFRSSSTKAKSWQAKVQQWLHLHLRMGEVHYVHLQLPLLVNGRWESSNLKTIWKLKNSSLSFSVLLNGIGVYAVIDKWTSGEGFRLDNVYDVIFNLAFLLIIVGSVVSIVSPFSIFFQFQTYVNFHFRWALLAVLEHWGKICASWNSIPFAFSCFSSSRWPWRHWVMMKINKA